MRRREGSGVRTRTRKGASTSTCAANGLQAVRRQHRTREKARTFLARKCEVVAVQVGIKVRGRRYDVGSG
jgi:hypothetical protein